LKYIWCADDEPHATSLSHVEIGEKRGGLAMEGKLKKHRLAMSKGLLRHLSHFHKTHDFDVTQQDAP
jgi:hypothetical protein